VLDWAVAVAQTKGRVSASQSRLSTVLTDVV